jgi:2-desacetyl-2-hydroxyethyl bacteriochlorophyllide A dehydrogenase
MRAVRIASGQPVLVDVEEPAGDGVLLEVASSSICGTDVGLLTAGLEGFTLGHEFAGWVDGVPYAVEPTIWCGQCPECLAGYTQRCVGEHRNLGVISSSGLITDGGLSDRIRVPAECLVALPAGLDVTNACLVEPASVAWHGIQRAAIQPGERVVVVGGGSIGLLAVAAVRAGGHQVAIEARHPHQQAAAEALGAAKRDGEYDVVIEAAGSESGLVRCAELARPGGRVVVLGVFFGALPVPGVATLVKELTWIGAMAYGRHDGHREVEAAAALLANEPLIAETLITHRFGLDEAAEAFRVAGDRGAGAIKVALHP